MDGHVPAFAPDLTAIRDHLDHLFRRCSTEYPGGLCEIAWAVPTGAVTCAELFPTTIDGLDRAVQCAAARNAEQRNVYVGVNPRKPGTFPTGRGDARDIELAFFQFVDCDSQDGVKLLERAPLAYSLAVVTGHTPSPRLHAYWELDVPTFDMEAWSAQQCALREHFKGDAVIDPPRIMRLAGTVNYPARHKVCRGYRIENVTICLRCDDDEERPAVTSEALSIVYPVAGPNRKAPSGAETEYRPTLVASRSSIEIRLASIRSGHEWHNNTRDLVAYMVASGYERAVILGLAEHITLPGYTVDQTARELRRFYDSAVPKFGARPAVDLEDFDAHAGIGEWDAGEDEKPIPPREWLLGTTFCRGFISSLIADGGIGKSATRIAQALAMATGRPLTGEHVFRRCRVLLVSLEDDRNELRRRVRAAILHHNVKNDDLKGWLFLATPGPKGWKLAVTERGAHKIGTLARYVTNTIEARNIDLVILDPLVKAHSVDENSNNAVDFVAGILATIACEHNCAVDAPHHISKGLADPGNANRGRGASAFKDAARLVYTLTPMSDDEAKRFGITEDERRSLIRMDSGKVNIAPPSVDARWFKIIGVPLGNGTAAYPHGDVVQVIEPWTPPDLWRDLSDYTLNRILDEIDRGLPNGKPPGGRLYSDHPQATDRWAWRIVQKHLPHLNEDQAREIIRVWVRNNVVTSTSYYDEQERKDKKGFRVNPANRPGPR
jgi:hypothetical protein